MTKHVSDKANQNAGMRNARPALSTEDEKGFKPDYDKSWAVVIGINHYDHFNGLERANLDAAGMAELLINKLAFPKENVFVVLDPPPDELSSDVKIHSRYATKRVIEDLIMDRLPREAKVDDRVLIFYAGHGERRPVPEARLDNIGYLVPSDAQPDKWHTFIEWDAIMRAGDYCPAKHMFYLLDACYSGIAASRAILNASKFTEDMLKARVRQVLTAGTAKQAVTDVGPKGHSLFTSYVLEGLNGAAALSDEGIITASELMVYVRDRVASAGDAKQTPAFSTLDTEPGGDFVFVLPPQKKPSSDLSKWIRFPTHSPQPTPVSDAMVMAMEASLMMQGTPARLSPEKLIELGRVLDSDKAKWGGEFLMTIINAAQAFGVPVIKLEGGSDKARANVGLAKLSDSVPQATCNARCTIVEKVDEIPDQLALGRPVVLGINWFASFFEAKDGVLVKPAKKENLMGGTAVTIVGYNAQQDTFRFAGPWEPNWGDHGFGTITREMLNTYASKNQIWAVEAKLFVWGT